MLAHEKEESHTNAAFCQPTICNSTCIVKPCNNGNGISSNDNRPQERMRNAQGVTI